MAGKEEGPGFKLLLRDINPEMVKAWEAEEAFGEDKFQDLVEVRDKVMVATEQW